VTRMNSIQSVDGTEQTHTFCVRLPSSPCLRIDPERSVSQFPDLHLDRCTCVKALLTPHAIDVQTFDAAGVTPML
jgi:hypothetical protein